MDHQKRQHRPRGFNDPKHAHELTFSCYQKYPLLLKERTCLWLAEQLEVVCRELQYDLWAYVFMPDHVHLIVYPRLEEYDTSQFLKRLKEPVSRKAVQFLKQEAPEWLERICVRRGSRSEHHFWQLGRGYDRNIMRGRTLLAMVEYTHMNPVRKQLVATVAEWKWSSAGWYQDLPLNTLKPDSVPWDWLEDDK